MVKTEIEITIMEGTLECMDDHLWGLWKDEKFTPLAHTLDGKEGKHVRITIEAWNENESK